MASGATLTIPGKKKYRQSAAVHQGAGALALISRSIVIPPRPILPPYYFAATASNSFGVSDFSNEVIYTRYWKSGISEITLAWNSSTNALTYWIHKGRTNRVYTISYPAGTNLFMTVPLAWPTLSNLVITVTCMNGGTNIAYSTSLAGPWTKLNTTNWSATNPPAPRYFRGIGARSNIVKISEYSY